MEEPMRYKVKPELLDKIRVDKDLSSDEKLAHYLGLSLGTVRLLRAGSQPSLQTVIRVMNAADVTDIKAATSIAA